MTDLIDISKDMTPEFFANKDFKRGKVLIFNFEGSETHLKIVRLNRKSRTCLVREVNLLTETELKEQLNGRN